MRGTEVCSHFALILDFTWRKHLWDFTLFLPMPLSVPAPEDKDKERNQLIKVLIIGHASIFFYVPHARILNIPSTCTL